MDQAFQQTENIYIRGAPLLAMYDTAGNAVLEQEPVSHLVVGGARAACD